MSCSLFLFSCDICSPTESIDPNIVTFSDINFELVIRESLNKQSGNITKSDMVTITYLEGWSKGIISIDGIEYCKNLEVFNLLDNQISDISVLVGLPNLTGIGLTNNQINDISILADLTNLIVIDLARNPISDFNSLSGLNRLESLSLYDNAISDISFVVGLTNLITLNLRGNQISDIYPLVQNQGINSGDTIHLYANPLSETSINTYIPQLEARGVEVIY